ncbi:MAG: hypothetical protein RR420_00970 [Anaerovoracaceae bacterium]
MNNISLILGTIGVIIYAYIITSIVFFIKTSLALNSGDMDKLRMAIFGKREDYDKYRKRILLHRNRIITKTVQMSAKRARICGASEDEIKSLEELVTEKAMAAVNKLAKEKYNEAEESIMDITNKCMDMLGPNGTHSSATSTFAILLISLFNPACFTMSHTKLLFQNIQAYMFKASLFISISYKRITRRNKK